MFGKTYMDLLLGHDSNSGVQYIIFLKECKILKVVT